MSESSEGREGDGIPPAAKPPGFNLPPGIQVQRGTSGGEGGRPASLTNLPPGISIKSGSTETKKINLPPGISVQSNANSSSGGGDKAFKALPSGISVSNGSNKDSGAPKLPPGTEQFQGALLLFYFQILQFSIFKDKNSCLCVVCANLM